VCRYTTCCVPWCEVGRATKGAGAGADAVCVFATLRQAGEEDTTLLVRQFRPPMRGETVELPAGLIDAGEAGEDILNNHSTDVQSTLLFLHRASV